VAEGDVDLAVRLISPLALAGTRAGYATGGWAAAVMAIPGAANHPLYPAMLAWSGWGATIAGDLDLGLTICRGALQLAEAPGVDERVLFDVLSHTLLVLRWAWQLDEGARLARRRLEIARGIGDDAMLAQALSAAWEAYRVGGDVAAAMAWTDEGLILARRLGNPSRLCNAASSSAMARWETDPERALADVAEGLQAAESVGNQLGIIVLMTVSINIRIIQGQWRQVIPLTLRKMAEAYQAGDQIGFVDSMMNAALILEAMNQDEAAAILQGAAGVDARQPGPLADRFADSVAALRSRLGEDRFEACVARGKNMTDDELFNLVDDKLQSFID
jgi:hypothetical protein